MNLLTSPILFLATFFFCYENNFIPNSFKDAPILTISRSIDKSEVHYFINLKSKDEINIDDPISLLWKSGKNGNYEKLNWIKKKYGYGLKFYNVKKDYAEFQFVSSKKKTFIIRKNSVGKFVIISKYNDLEMELNHIFVIIDGGSFWMPNVTKVELSGKRTDNNSDFIEVFKP